MNRGWMNLVAGGLSTLALTLWIAQGALSATPDTVPAPATLSTAPATQPAELGPDVVMLRELVDLYEPVPFNHRGHAQMSQMWDGCVTCHHRSPEPTTQPVTQPAILADRTQDGAAAVPACKSCHEATADDADIRRPSLKGAYHRQCLNCHREWMHANACVICHKARGQNPQQEPTSDDIVGRMHPPIQVEPEINYVARFTPADGPRVLFRHSEHAEGFGIRCATCHRHDNCAHCHAPGAAAVVKPSQKPVHPAGTWRESHGPCVSCHQQDRCRHCHYQDDQEAPKAFAHATTGQELDADHAKLACKQCHVELKLRAEPTCGGIECHKPGKPITFPIQRPGKVIKALATQPTTQMQAMRPGTARRVQDSNLSVQEGTSR